MGKNMLDRALSAMSKTGKARELSSGSQEAFDAITRIIKAQISEDEARILEEERHSKFLRSYLAKIIKEEFVRVGPGGQLICEDEAEANAEVHTCNRQTFSNKQSDIPEFRAEVNRKD